MNSIACTTGDVAASRVRDAIAARSPKTSEFRSPVGGATVLAGSDGGAVLGFACSATSAVAALGAGLATLDPDPDRAAQVLLTRLDADDEELLRSLPPDLVVLGVTSAGDVVMVGRAGQQRLSRTGSPLGPGELVASSEVGLVAHGIGPAAVVDRGYEDFLLTYAFLPDGHTLCRGVETLPVDTVVRADAAHGTATTAPATADEPLPSSGALLDDLYRLLLDVVAEQAGDQDDVAVLLGGVDSALVAALLHRLGHRVHTFTFQFEDARYNQRNVERTCEQIGAEHTWVPITVDVIADGLHRYGDVYNQPVAQPHYLLHTLVSCEAIRRAGLRHVFSGDGADAALLGYPRSEERRVGKGVASRWAQQ